MSATDSSGMRAKSRIMASQNTAVAVLQRIDRRLKALGLSDNKASEAATGSRDTLRTIRRNVERGAQRGISTETIRKLAPVLQTTEEWLIKATGPESVGESDHIDSADILPPDAPAEDKWIEIVGYVGAGALTHRYAVGHGALERVPPPDDATDKTVAVQIMGDSLGELFDRWLVFYDEVRTPITPDLIGKLCVVGLPDDRVLIKKVIRSKTKPGAYDLLSNQEEPIQGVEIAWAARVKTMVPR